MKYAEDLERDAVLQVASFMAAAARTAPKTRGVDNIEVIAVDDQETRNRLVERMREISRAENRPSFERDAHSIGASGAIVIVGVRANPAGLNCGFCGHPTCAELSRAKGICAFNSMDLGIATSSAASIACRFHIDNRLMYSIGRAALDLGLFENKAALALGIPLSATGKNPYFDRK